MNSVILGTVFAAQHLVPLESDSKTGEQQGHFSEGREIRCTYPGARHKSFGAARNHDSLRPTQDWISVGIFRATAVDHYRVIDLLGHAR